MPPLFNFILPALSIAAIVFALISIILPGVFIWIALKLLGKERGIVRCGLANFAALVFASIIAAILHLTPLIIFAPLLSFVVYLYALKSLLDISFLEALAATIIASIVIFFTALILMAIFGTWLLFLPQPHMAGVRF